MQGYNVEAAMSDAIRDYNWDQNTDTNWFDEFMGTSWSKQHSLSFQGSNDKGQYFANLTYVNQDGIVKGKNDYYERLTAQINADYKIKPGCRQVPTLLQRNGVEAAYQNMVTALLLKCFL